MNRADTSFLKQFAAEPYRILFPLGILFGILGVSHWLFYALGWIKSYSSFLHSSTQMQAYMGCFVFGFLMTALPRFVSAEPATPVEFLTLLASMVLMTSFYWTGKNQWGQWCYLGILLLFFRFAVVRFKKKNSQVQPPVEFVWLPIAFLSGFLGVLLMLLGPSKFLAPEWMKAGKALADQGFLLAVVSGVGGFLGPRLMGVHQLIKAGQVQDPAGYRHRKIRMHLTAGVLLFASFLLEATAFQKQGAFLRAFVVTWAFWYSRTLVTKPLVRDQFVWLLWGSFWMVLLGTWAVAIFPAYRLASLHIIFIGGYAVMTFAVATMVIFSHAGSPERLRKPSKTLTVIGVSLGVGVVIRVMSIFFAEQYFVFIGTAAACWLVAAVGWLCHVVPHALMFPASPEEAERCHEEAKQRVRDLRRE